MKKPIIGLNLDYTDNGTGFSRHPWHALRSNYFDTIHKGGGLPIGIPATIEDIDSYLDLLDGLVATGGNDYDPQLFGEEVSSPYVKVMKQRSAFDIALVKGALKRNLPVLGICAGFQAINIVFGGPVIQHIPDTLSSSIEHLIQDATVPSHPVEIVPNTHLSKILGGAPEIEVNSFHHQGINSVGKGLIINALAPDGLIEGIEHPDYKFCIGVQWHPEFSVTPNDDKVIQAFIKAAS